MTIDERLEKLTERHEALTQTVEVTAGMQRENEKEFAQLGIYIRQLAEISQRHEQRLDDIEGQ